MKRFAFIGAGSYEFTRNLSRDILTFPAFSDATLVLMDPDGERLSYAKQAVEKIIEAGKYSAKVIATTDRAEALKGADGVLSTLRIGDVGVWGRDTAIPMKYGVDLCIGDTRSVSGIFRFLRTAPVMLDILKDIEKYCPNAVFLNYTNPMAMLCRIMQNESRVNVTGLCHSVQGTAKMLARWIGAPFNEITYTCAGVNHQAFYIDYKWNGADAYPLIRKAVEEPEIYNEEIVRNQMFKHLGFYVTESSGHNSEYVQWFRKRPDLIERYCTHGTGWNPGLHDYSVNRYLQRQQTWKQEFLDFTGRPAVLERGQEYAAYIFNAVFGDGELFEFNGNIRNFGLIDNLPEGCCVEVPVLASRKGLQGIHVGALPAQLALLNNTTARIEEMAVEGALTGDPEMIYRACYFDPLASAVLSLDEIRAMTREMFEANREYLPQFRHFN